MYASRLLYYNKEVILMIQEDVASWRFVPIYESID